MSTTVRVSGETHQRLVELAGTTGRHIQALVDEAVAAYQADLFWADFEATYERLADDDEQWREIEAERAGEASALQDQATDG